MILEHPIGTYHMELKLPFCRSSLRKWPRLRNSVLLTSAFSELCDASYVPGVDHPTSAGWPKKLTKHIPSEKKVKVLVAQLCPTLSDPMNSSPPGSSVHRILQARILGWVAIPFSEGSSRPRDQTQVSQSAGRFFILWATSPSTYPGIKQRRDTHREKKGNKVFLIICLRFGELKMHLNFCTYKCWVISKSKHLFWTRFGKRETMVFSGLKSLQDSICNSFSSVWCGYFRPCPSLQVRCCGGDGILITTPFL